MAHHLKRDPELVLAVAEAIYGRPMPTREEAPSLYLCYHTQAQRALDAVEDHVNAALAAAALDFDEHAKIALDVVRPVGDREVIDDLSAVIR